ncbi:YgcG family protein [Alsobacter sp. KACC 23698]|uniref:YgcG family protein n=1 Tax=Alsobacter sp. KACC 23698 TaxID=3149229 RepID=A0AAU7JD10_9HYPH
MTTHRFAAALLALAFGLTAAWAALTFPALTGRVVDQASILSPDAVQRIDAKLKAHEDKTSDQVVVATVPSLQGTSVEDYANQLFRAWKLGQAKTNNGVLLLVAPNERKVRIEVGYGLEGALTDALSKVIISTAVAPKFKSGDFAGGIEAGVDAIVSILTGDAEEWQRRAKVRPQDDASSDWIMNLVVMAIVLFILWRMMSGGRGGPGAPAHRTRGGNWIVVPTGGGGFGGGFSGGGGWSGGSGGFGGGFFGGGGSSGGGGASGDW